MNAQQVVEKAEIMYPKRLLVVDCTIELEMFLQEMCTELDTNFDRTGDVSNNDELKKVIFLFFNLSLDLSSRRRLDG